MKRLLTSMKLLWIPGSLAIYGQIMTMFAGWVNSDVLDEVGTYFFATGLIGLIIAFVIVVIMKAFREK